MKANGRSRHLPDAILDESDIVRFIEYLIEVENLNFHPDTRFQDYISYEDGQATYTPDGCAVRNQLVDQCFQLAGDRVYDIGLRVFLPTLMPTIQAI